MSSHVRRILVQQTLRRTLARVFTAPYKTITWLTSLAVILPTFCILTSVISSLTLLIKVFLRPTIFCLPLLLGTSPSNRAETVFSSWRKTDLSCQKVQIQSWPLSSIVCLLFFALLPTVCTGIAKYPLSTTCLDRRRTSPFKPFKFWPRTLPL